MATVVAPEKSDFEIAYIVGDGNCFFRCISQFFNGTQMHHKTIREKIVHTMKGNKEFYSQYIDDTDIDRHIDNITRSEAAHETDTSFWATEAEILAASETYKRIIFIKRLIGNSWEWHKYSYNNQLYERRDGIPILYNGNHYSLIKNINITTNRWNESPNITLEKAKPDWKNLSQKRTNINPNLILIKNNEPEPQKIKKTDHSSNS